ncbi:MAG: beta-ketoacyl synthase N-terminal-like domain-containing protein, partial [Xanthomonadales bacterium]|nr:beta-ketoacyl synthase N-terminal-like domain-containing protein [Xanthomonadales bacterium]
MVVTGAGAVSALGNDWPEAEKSLRSLKNCVQHMPDWQVYRGLNTQLAAPINNFELPASFTRRRIRGMGRVAQLATVASEKALKASALLDDPILQSGRTGVSYGSSTGSPPAVAEFGNMLINQTLDGITATTYIRMMGHTAAVNIGVFFGLQGRIIPTSTACTSGSMGIGYAYEAIRHGLQDVMLAGGAEELCPT